MAKMGIPVSTNVCLATHSLAGAVCVCARARARACVLCSAPLARAIV